MIFLLEELLGPWSEACGRARDSGLVGRGKAHTTGHLTPCHRQKDNFVGLASSFPFHPNN
jgi:hypothetical protein